jgi:hypothetical protein
LPTIPGRSITLPSELSAARFAANIHIIPLYVGAAQTYI